MYSICNIEIVNIKDKKGEHSGAVMMLVKIVENGL
jgi:hypothetical protein